MKVAEIISDTNIGGAGRLLITRLKNSKRDEIDTVVILPTGSKLKDKLEAIDIKVYEIDGCADRSFDVLAIWKFYKLINKIAPDIINTHGCMSARIAGLLCRVPIRVYTRHCAYPVPWIMKMFPIRQICGALNSLLSTKIIAVAEAAKKNLTDMGVPEKRIEVIINGVDGLEKYSEDKRTLMRQRLGVEKNFVVGICARLERCKGHECFLRAARILLNEDKNYRFLIVGGGNLMGELKELSRALGIDESVIFTGFTDDVERYFNCFDLNVNCSVGTETSSLALSEGMSIGLPCVASAYGGNPYMVQHGSNGFIYSINDFYDLADMIKRLSGNKELYKKMSDAAYKRYTSELNSAKMTAETEALYKALYENSLRKIERTAEL